ncbi:MAG TPA: glutathione peroxidase [Polyangia bacterium]|jgi:glutathione peroxidase|nr:glutathione peroxidase [Polyangia bacterium]HVR02807.1 glutathione peroxidase [Polyangia bacterium]
MSLHDISATTIDGETQSLGEYKGKVVLVVNTASECGSTPQYAGLEGLWRHYRDKGLVVLGFPSNDFGGQEPGDEASIKTFCTTKFKVSFPLFSKVKVTGQGQSPVYRFLAADYGEPKWNFYKYLVSREGKVIKAFPNSVAPEDATLRAAVEAALG